MTGIIEFSSDTLNIEVSGINNIPVDLIEVISTGQDIYVSVETDQSVLAVNGRQGFITLNKSDVGLQNVENISITGVSGVLNQKINNLSGAAVLTYGNQTINGEKNFTSLKRSNINVSVIPTLKDLFGDLYLGPFWDYDTLQLPAERNVIYYVPTSWAPPLVRNIRLPRAGNLAGDSLIVSTNYMPPSSAINFYSYDPGPGWVLIDSWSNASFDGLYRPFNLSVITYQDSNAFNTPWTKQANRWTITPPVSVNSAGTAGDLSFDGINIYVCVGQNSWRRLSASTWN
jgi:hypothetical protein